jgi:hypothetical protein
MKILIRKNKIVEIKEIFNKWIEENRPQKDNF